MLPSFHRGVLFEVYIQVIFQENIWHEVEFTDDEILVGSCTTLGGDEANELLDGVVRDIIGSNKVILKQSTI